MKHLARLLIVLILLGMLAACAAPAAEQPAAEEPAAEEPAAAEAEAEEPAVVAEPSEVDEPETEEAAPVETEEIASGPQVGGRFVFASDFDPDTLDPHRALTGYGITRFTGSTLVALHPETKEIVPYLAKSWEISEDGLTYTFFMRDDVTFQDGTPLTAQDYAFTLNRLVAPETASPYASFAPTFASAEALDELTLVIRLLAPDYYYLFTLADPVMQPLSESYVTELGDNFGREPNGVGPFIPNEWVTGEKVVLERNPTYNWGPEFTHGGPPYIEYLEFRILPDHDTIIAGLEAGELDFALLLTPNLLDRLVETGKFDVHLVPNAGTLYSIYMNTAREPFDNLLVRKAFNLAVDRDLIVKVAGNGLGEVMHGPISSSTIGYWPGVEEIGYGYDLEQAKALMQEAGYTYNDDGMLEKDGEPLVLELMTYTVYNTQGEVIQEQLKALGVQVELLAGDFNLQFMDQVAGNYDMGITGFNWGNATVLQWIFNSNNIGATNIGYINDPEMDRLLNEMVSATTSEANMEAAAAVQRRSIEQAYTVPLYASSYPMLSSKRFTGVQVPDQFRLYLWDVHLVNP